jgi:hypothetical protein
MNKGEAFNKERQQWGKKVSNVTNSVLEHQFWMGYSMFKEKGRQRR